MNETTQSTVEDIETTIDGAAEAAGKKRKKKGDATPADNHSPIAPADDGGGITTLDNHSPIAPPKMAEQTAGDE